MAADEASNRKRVFISYKRDVTPDKEIAGRLEEALKQEHSVFIDQLLPVGANWGRLIDEQLSQSDFVIVLLSDHSIGSEMVEGELKRAHELARLQNGRPAILPVRLRYREPFRYPLNTYLDHINWADWSSEADTPGLIEQLNAAVANRPGGLLQAPIVGPTGGAPSTASTEAPYSSAPPLEQPDGTMELRSKFYVLRSCDAQALRVVGDVGVTITIKGPRQIGKSSLLNRIQDTTSRHGRRVAMLDFQQVEKHTLQNAETFFRQFCARISVKLGLEVRTSVVWNDSLGLVDNCTRYLESYVLPEVGGRLALALDEVDIVFDATFRDDFFGMLRSWHNLRATEPVWTGLDLALVTSTEPYQLIAALNQSPFNVGEVLEPEDFTLVQTIDLSKRHGPILSDIQVERLWKLLGGHPYLVRRALYLIATGRLDASQLFETASSESGPFRDHLRHHVYRLHERPELIRGLLHIIRQNQRPTDDVIRRLRGAGLIRERGYDLEARCPLYSEYFGEHLRG